MQSNSQLNGSLSFIENLSHYIENEDQYIEDGENIKDKIKRLFSNTQDQANTGKILRIFENVPFHLKAFNKKMFLGDLLENYVLPDIINPQTWLIKDELLALLDYNSHFATKTLDEKFQITKYFIDAYLFYFKSGIYSAVGFKEIQERLITAQDLAAIEKIKVYLPNHEFAFAHRLIVDAVNTHNIENTPQFFKNPTHHTLMQHHLINYPSLREKLKDCMGFYRILGYADTAEKLLTNLKEEKPDVLLCGKKAI